MPDLFRLSVLTPGKTLLDVADVRQVRLKLADHAWLSIYPRHAPLLAETLAGPVTYTTEAGAETIALSESILQVANDAVTLFTGGELAASLAVMSPGVSGVAEDEDAAYFDRLARVLLLSLSAHPGEGLDEFADETEGERA